MMVSDGFSEAYWEGPRDGFDSSTWEIVASICRDSNGRDFYNYRRKLNSMMRRFPGDVEEHRFAHWGVGWINHIFARISRKEKK